MSDRCHLEQLSVELLVQVLTHLNNPADLARVSSLNSYWRKVTSEEAIWRALTSAHFPAARRLPTQQSWKALYRLNSNWSHGRAAPIRLALRSQVLAEPPSSLEISDLPAKAESSRSTTPIDSAPTPRTLVQFSKQYIFTASRLKDSSNPIPAVSVERMRPDGSAENIGAIYSSSLLAFYAERPHLMSADFALSIQEMQLDEAQPLASDSLRLAVFYSTGQFVMFRLDLSDSALEIHEEYASVRASNDTIMSARFHCPLLVTCTKNLVIRFHLLKKSPDSDRFDLVESNPALQTNLAWQPSVLTLKRTGKFRFRASFVYSTPFYSVPSGWTLGMQEFFINLSKDSSSNLEPLSIETHSAICIPDPHSNAFSSTPLISSIQQSGQYIVSSRLDNTIDLHEVVPASGRRPLALIHRRTLFGHTTSVNNISFRGRRAVSAGADGKLRVWDFGRQKTQRSVEVRETSNGVDEADKEEDWSIAPLTKSLTANLGSPVEWLGFDEEKIVCVESPSPQRPLKVLSFV